MATTQQHLEVLEEFFALICNLRNTHRAFPVAFPHDCREWVEDYRCLLCDAPVNGGRCACCGQPVREREHAIVERVTGRR